MSKNRNFLLLLVYNWDALRNLVPFLQFEKREKHPCRSVTLNKFQASACNLTKSTTPQWVPFTFYIWYKWYQIAQNITIRPQRDSITTGKGLTRSIYRGGRYRFTGSYKVIKSKKKKKKDQNFLMAQALGMNEHVQKIEIRKMR